MEATAPVVYPDSDGKPMADNTKQSYWIRIICGSLEDLYGKDPNVFVGCDLLWYPIKDDPDTRYAPDVFVVFGRPKGHRGSYKQWEENDIPMSVVFEIRSPSNSDEEMAEKLMAYDELEVDEYYLYDPDKDRLTAYKRGLATLVQMRFDKAIVSPRLGIRFDLSGPEMRVYFPNGEPFLDTHQIQELRRQEKLRAENEAKRADDAIKRADDEARQKARVIQLTRKIALHLATPEEIREWDILCGESG